LAISSLWAEVEPGVLFSTAQVDAATVLVRERDLEIALGPLSSRLELKPGGLRIDEARIEKDSSFVSLSGTLEEIRFEHAIDASLLAELDPRLEIEGLVEGEGTLTLEPGANAAGEGALRAKALTSGELGPVAIDAPWRFEGDLASAEVSFETLAPSAVAPLSSRASGRVSLELEKWDWERARGEGLVTLQGVPRTGALPLSGDVRLRVESRKIAFEARRLTAPGLAIDASGIVGDEIAVDYRARIHDLSDTEYLFARPIPLRGALDLEGRIHGPRDAVAIDARVSAPDVGLGAASFSIEGDVALLRSRLEISDLTLRHEAGGSSVVRGTIPTKSSAGAWNLSARVDSLELRGVPEALSSGTVSGTVAVTGEFSRPEVAIAFETSSLETADGFRADVQGEASSQGMSGNASLRLENASLRGVSLPGAAIALQSDGSTAS
ncbi:MAG: hypothetical protein ACRD21_26055, partial [Vicinamibacteria bacterium]